MTQFFSFIFLDLFLFTANFLSLDAVVAGVCLRTLQNGVLVWNLFQFTFSAISHSLSSLFSFVRCQCVHVNATHKCRNQKILCGACEAVQQRNSGIAGISKETTTKAVNVLTIFFSFLFLFEVLLLLIKSSNQIGAFIKVRLPHVQVHMV